VAQPLGNCAGCLDFARYDSAVILHAPRVTQHEDRAQTACIRVRAIPHRAGEEATMDEQSRALGAPVLTTIPCRARE